MGTAVSRRRTLNHEHLIVPDADMHNTPFYADEIWDMINRMSAHNALGLMGSWNFSVLV